MTAIIIRPTVWIFKVFLATLAISLSNAQTTPTITAVSSGVGTTTKTTVAPGGIIMLTGTNLAQGVADLGGYTSGGLPMSLGGVQVTIGGSMIPLFMVSPTAIVAQVPFEVAPGQQAVILTSGTASSVALNITVAMTAPALFFEGTAAMIVKASDNSLVGAGNPAAPGDVLLIYATGLGMTTPPAQTGIPTPPSLIANTAPVTVAIGNQPAEVLYSVAAPGFAGLYQVAVRVPAGVTGTIPVVLQAGAASSTAVSIIAGIVRAPQIDPQIQAVFAQYMALRPKPIETLTPQEARQQPSFADALKALLQNQGRSTAPEPVASVQDRTIPGAAGQIPARIYTPQGAGPFPVIVYFHGGGFVIATIDTYDASARALTNAAGAILVAVEYRKAPENKFPAAPEDAYAATQWVMSNAASFNGRADRVAVAGESAGGNLSTVVCMMARDRMGKMPVYQALVYPVTNLASESRSYEENANAPFLTRAALRWFGGHYLPSVRDALNPYASPLLGDLHGLPPATVITAGFDPLRDEGAGYADKLREAGVQVNYRNFETATHEFFGMGAVVDIARTAEQLVGSDLKAALAP